MKLDRECVKLWQEKDRSYLRNFRTTSVKNTAKNLFITTALTVVNTKANGINTKTVTGLQSLQLL
jgi:hypothetical protein